LVTFSFANFKQQNLFWGFLVLFLFSFVALILAVLAVTPRTDETPVGRPSNPLFFGDFSTMSLEKYNATMHDVMRSDQATYEAVVNDIHSIGTMLKNRKYRYLSLSYRWFLVGIIAAGSLFFLQTVLFYFT
jgi:hypothetical protein